MPPQIFRVVVPINDAAAADAFWSTILDLGVDATVPTRHYIRTGGAIIALVDTAEHERGHGHEPEAFRPNPDWIYIRVPDLDATWARAEKLGCSAPRTDEGRSFYTHDPAGNGVCFMDDVRSETSPARAKYLGKPIANLCNVGLPTQSLDRAKAFYEELLQIEADTTVFYLDACQLSLVDVPDAPAFRPNPDLTYFAVDDLDACYERSQKLRMQSSSDQPSGIQTHPWGERSFYGTDPSGNPICFVDDQTLYLGIDP
jgi:predicted enzyme related to lactoylglutathione lyase